MGLQQELTEHINLQHSPVYCPDKAELKIISWKGKKYLLEVTANDKENDSVENEKK